MPQIVSEMEPRSEYLNCSRNPPTCPSQTTNKPLTNNINSRYLSIQHYYTMVQLSTSLATLVLFAAGAYAGVIQVKNDISSLTAQTKTLSTDVTDFSGSFSQALVTRNSSVALVVSWFDWSVTLRVSKKMFRKWPKCWPAPHQMSRSVWIIYYWHIKW